MTVLHQLGLMVVTFLVMFACGVLLGASWSIFPLAFVGGWCVSQYDDGRAR